MHARFRNGIFLLAALLTIIVLIVYLYPYKQQNFKTNELAEFHNTVDSLRKIISTCTVSYAIKPFNPNFISDYKGYQLGLSAKEVDRIRDYRNQNKWINSISDFKNVTKISDKRLQKISPLFKFPKWVQKKNSQRKRYSTRHLSFYQKIDLNKATVAQLQEKVMIPDFIAKRIIRYREKIGGFVNDIQLKDVVI